MCTLLFGIVIFCFDFAFYLIFKERLYLAFLIFIFIILIFVLSIILKLKKDSYTIDCSGIYFNKKKKIIFKDSKICKIKLSKNENYCLFFDESENLITRIQIKHFSYEELQILYSILNRFELIK